MADTKIRLAVIGTGPRWLDLAKVYMNNPCLDVVAVCDRAEGAAEEAAKQLHDNFGCNPKVFTKYEDMVKNACYDAVFISCDPDIQVDYACLEMERGIHVMTEVPAAYTIEECHALVNTVKKTGVKYQLAEQTRYWDFIRKWREMAERGEFGNIFYAEGEYLHFEEKWDFFRNKKTGHRIWTNDKSLHQNPDWEVTWRYRAFTDPIWYLPHELSPLLSITGGRIDRVSCMGSPLGKSYTDGFNVRDIECAIMHNTNGSVFCLRAGFTAPYGKKKDTSAHWYQIKGTEKTVEWARSKIDEPKSFTLSEGWVAHPEWSCKDKNADDIFKNASHGGADYYPLYYFVDSILNDKTPPMDVYRAVETAAPAILAAKSAREGGILIEVPDFRK